MADLFPAFVKTLQAEGGYVDHPADRGGATKYGISSRQYPLLDIAALTVEEALKIYRRDYWEQLDLDHVNSQAVAEELFDTALVMGPQKAVEIVQRALNFLGSHLAIDGILGPVTLAALNDYPFGNDLLKTLNGVQFMVFLKIVESDWTQLANARGWLKRINL